MSQRSFKAFKKKDEDKMNNNIENKEENISEFFFKDYLSASIEEMKFNDALKYE